MRKITLLTTAIILTLTTTGYSKDTFTRERHTNRNDHVRHTSSNKDFKNISKIEVVTPWVRPAIKGGNTAIYAELVNPTNNIDELTNAHSKACQRVELHTHKEDKGVMSMQRVGLIQIPHSGNKKLEPGGYHIMCIGLNRDLTPGDVITVDMKFKHAGKITTSIPAKINKNTY